MYIQVCVLLVISPFMSGIGEEKRLGNSNHSIFYRDGFTLHLLGSLFAHDVNLCQPFPSERCSAILSWEGWLFDTCGPWLSPAQPRLLLSGMPALFAPEEKPFHCCRTAHGEGTTALASTKFETPCRRVARYRTWPNCGWWVWTCAGCATSAEEYSDAPSVSPETRTALRHVKPRWMFCPWEKYQLQWMPRPEIVPVYLYVYVSVYVYVYVYRYICICICVCKVCIICIM